MSSEQNAASQLAGLKLPGGWNVIKKIPILNGATGGNFSIGYEVLNDNGSKGFLKAMDFSGAFGEEQPMLALQSMAASYNFEKAILEKCKKKGLSRVVAAIGDGTIRVSHATPYPDVPYLIFELADCDLRTFIDLSKQFDFAWALRSLHHIAIALEQIHSEGIAHQDLKPSNVLVFDGTSSKIGDFGKSADRTFSSPHEHDIVPGDKSYAPPELLYDSIDLDNWNCRRLGCDIYLLGSLLSFLFTRVAITSSILSKMNPAHRPQQWSGTFSEVLPYFRNAFGQSVLEFKAQVPVGFQEELVAALRYLTEPDYKLRGHPLNRVGHTNQYSLERFISIFDRLATRAELGLLKS